MNPRNLEDLVLDVESKNRIVKSIPFFFLILGQNQESPKSVIRQSYSID